MNKPMDTTTQNGLEMSKKENQTKPQQQFQKRFGKLFLTKGNMRAFPLILCNSRKSDFKDMLEDNSSIPPLCVENQFSKAPPDFL
jgi:hypothetical protein